MKCIDVCNNVVEEDIEHEKIMFWPIRRLPLHLRNISHFFSIEMLKAVAGTVNIVYVGSRQTSENKFSEFDFYEYGET